MSTFSRNQKQVLRESAPLRMVILFSVIFTCLQLTYQASHETVVTRLIIDAATVQPSAFIINRIAPEERVRALGNRLVSSKARLSILDGCEGTESLFVLIAAIMAFRASWRWKVQGLILGMILIYTANQVRIVALYFALRHDRQLFAVLHGYVAPTLIIVLACLFYMRWMQCTCRQTPT